MKTETRKWRSNEFSLKFS